MVSSLGSTEVSNISGYLIDRKTRIQGHTVPVGYDFSQGIEVLILDNDLAEVGFNRIGQIAVRSRYMATGYWNRPDLTRAAFLEDPDGGELRTFLTGDLGRISDDGCLVAIRGRAGEVGRVEGTQEAPPPFKANSVFRWRRRKQSLTDEHSVY